MVSTNLTMCVRIARARLAVRATIGLVAPGMSRRLGPLPALMRTRLAAVRFFIVLAIYPHLAIALGANVVRTSSIGMCWPIDSTFVGDLIPPRVRSSDVSVRSGAWYVSYAVASFLAG
jgi:hypothetical protein